MPSAFRNQKNLHEWIELDYYGRPRPIKRWKRWAAWGVLVVCLAAGAAAWFWPRSSVLVQSGPVSSAHAMFSADCAQCHTEPFRTASKLAPWNAGVHAVRDEACVQCHEGPPHNTVMVEEHGCAACHREHRGRAALARVPDDQCTSCHADLKEHRKGGDAGLRFANVRGFNDDHPEFALWRRKETDPGKLRFNHAVHLQKGGVQGGKGGTVELQCVQCHVADAAGRYMQPIRYEQHCASCHQLSVRLAGDFKGDEQEKLDAAVQAFNATPAPHREPAVVRAVMRERLLDFARRFPVTPKQPEGGRVDRATLGKRREGADLVATEAEWRWMTGQLAEAERRLFADKQLPVGERMLFHPAGCGYCHVEDKGKRGPAGDGLAGLPAYAKTDLPIRWLPHSRFSHVRHRMLDCTECHDARGSKETSEVLLPKLDNCQRCHNPEVGVRNDCVECHGFHDRTLGKSPHGKLTIEQLLEKGR